MTLRKNLATDKVIEYCEEIRASVPLGGLFYANYFQQHLPQKSFSTFLSESCKSIVFIQPDEELNRVFFVTSDLNDLTVTLKDVPLRPLVLDYVGKELTCELKDAFCKVGFEIWAEFGRIINYNFGETTSAYIPNFATAADLNPLLTRMREDFDVFVDHICDYKTLTLLANAGQILLNIKDDKITGYLLYEIEKKRSFIRAWYSAIDDIVMGGMQLLGAYHRLMTQLDINSTYGWVDISNDPAVMIYQRYGYKFDGLIDVIMVRH